MKKTPQRKSRNYDGTNTTSYKVGDLLSVVLTQIGEVYKDRPDLVLASWPDIIGKQLAPMTQAVSFFEGVLIVKVKNSTLHSLLSQNDKMRILQQLRDKFPRLEIKNIVFRIG